MSYLARKDRGPPKNGFGSFLLPSHHSFRTHQTPKDVTMSANNNQDHPSFFTQISTRSQSINSLLCVGLDPHRTELNLPHDADENTASSAAYDFCTRIIDATSKHCVCYKPNTAFFESLGHESGVSTLSRVVEYIHARTECCVLLDVKRGDIGSTASAYAEACYDGLRGEGVTLSPLMGWDSVEPFVTGACYLCIKLIYWIFVSLVCLPLSWLWKSKTHSIYPSVIKNIYLLLFIELGSS